jgi:hypothetical protein
MEPISIDSRFVAAKSNDEDAMLINIHRAADECLRFDERVLVFASP